MKNILILFVLFLSFGASAQVLQNQGDKSTVRTKNSDKAAFQRDGREIEMFRDQLLRLEDAYNEKDDKSVLIAYQEIVKAMQIEVNQSKGKLAIQTQAAQDAQGTPAASELGTKMNKALSQLKSQEQIIQKFSKISTDLSVASETVNKAKVFLNIMEMDFEQQTLEMLKKAKQD